MQQFYFSIIKNSSSVIDFICTEISKSQTFSILAEDLILNPKEHPNAKLGDVVEIYQHPEEENGCRLLLQITCFKEDLKGRGISFYHKPFLEYLREI